MQIINHWPSGSLAVEGDIKEAICEHLLLPFTNTQEVSNFWEQSGTYLVIIEQSDDKSLINQLGEHFKQSLCNAINCYEYKETLASHYTISLSIISDDGAGIYLLVHDNNTFIPNLSG